MEIPYDANIWFTPRFAISHLTELFHKEGKNVLKDRKFQKAREAWILGLALLGINKKTNRFWWLQVPYEDPPDMLAMTIVADKEKNQNELNIREVEIAEITKFSDGTIEHEILRKLKNKSYLKETCLIVYISKKMTIENIQDISDKIQEKIRISDIWLIGAAKKDSSKHIIFSIYPKVEMTEFDVLEEMGKIPQGDRISFVRSKGTNITLNRNVPSTRFIP